MPSNKEIGKNIVWRIYHQVDKITAGENKYHGPNINYVEHLDIENCDSWTGNDLFYVGFSLLVEGEIEFYTDPTTKLKYARIYK